MSEIAAAKTFVHCLRSSNTTIPGSQHAFAIQRYRGVTTSIKATIAIASWPVLSTSKGPPANARVTVKVTVANAATKLRSTGIEVLD
jgi:hypothetical protein